VCVTVIDDIEIIMNIMRLTRIAYFEQSA